MARVLIVHASREGQTTRIAERMAAVLGAGGHEARLAASTPFPGLGGADGVIVAASVHRGRHPSALVRAVRAHRRVFRQLPSGFLSVCLCAAASDPMQRAEADGYLHDFLEATGWRPDLSASVAGALRYSRYGPVRRRFVHAMARRRGLPGEPRVDREYTDWSDVHRFAEAFSSLLDEAGAGPLETRRRTLPSR